jgi:hypothetical protein
VPKEGLLLRSEIAAVQLDFRSISADFYHGIREQIQAQTTLLRFAPYQSFSPGARPALDLSPLNIKDVFPFQRRLFRMGRGYKNKRGIAHKGLGAVVSFPLYVDAQLPHASLKDSAVQERSAHLYLICTRPKITVCPDIRVHRDWIEMELWFQQKIGTESERITFSHSGVHAATVDQQTRTHVVFYSRMETDNRGTSLCSISASSNQCFRSVIPPRSSPTAVNAFP